jgi:Chaperone of endosialidase
MTASLFGASANLNTTNLVTGNPQYATATGTGVDGQQIVLPNSAGTLFNLQVYFGYLRQVPGTDYRLESDGVTITLITAAPASVQILVFWNSTINIGEPTNGTVTPYKLSTGGPIWDTSGNLISLGNLVTPAWVKTGMGTNNVGGVEFPNNGVSSGSRSWRLRNDVYQYGDFAVLQATALGGNTFAPVLYSDPAGNVGFGTNSPGTKVDIQGTGTQKLRIQTNTSGNPTLSLTAAGSDTVDILYDRTNNALRFDISSITGAMYLSTAGNIGIGVVPSGKSKFETGTAGASINGVQAWFGSGGNSPVALAVHNANGDGYLGFNTVQSTSDNQTYFATATAAKIRSNPGTGGIQFFTAPSGTAGGAITFTQAMTLDASGNLLVRQNSSGNLNSRGFYADSSGYFGQNHQSGDASGSVYTYFGYNGATVGTITQSGTTGVIYNTTSDYRLKQNPKPLQVSSSANFIEALKPKEWTWKDGTKGVGFIAHEFQEVCPSAVVGTKDAVDDKGEPVYQAMDSSSPEVMANIIAELQALRKRIAYLESKNV